jgi:ATP-dependent helicase/nuclease subunit B
MAQISVWSGGAHRLLAPVIAKIGELHAQGLPCILLVPEQFTLQAERELLQRLHIPGFFTIDVLSPSRLSHRVLAAAGADERAPLSAAGRHMAVSIALERCENKLVYYASSAHRRGFTEKLASLIADMKRGGLTPEELAEYAQTLPEGMRNAKLTDLATVYTAYEATLANRFGDSEDQLRYVASRLAQSGLLNGQNVFVYGFDTLAEQLIALLCEIGSLCQSLTIALLCRPETAPDGELYRPVRQSIARFGEILKAHGLTLTQNQLSHTLLGHAPAVDHLDEALFAYPECKFAGEQQNVFLSQHMSSYEEATSVTRQILRLCAQGTEIERIALLYPDRNGYAFAVAAALTDSGLPYYTDEKLPASSHALARFLLAALRAMAGGYSREDVVAVMKSGYAHLTFAQACTLENYARAYGIDRKGWLTPFTRGDDVLAAACEALRKRMMEPLQKAREAIVAARDARASLSAVMELLTDIGAYETLRTEEKALLASGMAVRAGQNSQMWQTLMELLDQLHTLADGARIPLNRMAERFDCGFSAFSLAALPPASHMLHAGVLGHSLSGDMDAVFLLGLNDGVLTREADSLLTETERADAQLATGAYLGMTDESRTLFAKMDVKRAMTLPTQTLFLSYAKTDLSGAALRPLDLLDSLQTRLFDGLPETPVPPETLPLSATQALSALSDKLRDYADGRRFAIEPVWQERLAKLLRSPVTALATARLLHAADYRVQSVSLEPFAARALFNDHTLSVSRLEEFAACPFRHFVDYGLRPEIIKDWGVEPVDLGVLYHRSLQNFAGVAARYPAFPNVTLQEAEAMADEAIAPLIDRLLRGPMGDTARSLADFSRARRVIRRACVTVTRQLAAGDFSLIRAEARFGYGDAESLPPVPLRLNDGTEVLLQGKIDRIDRYTAPDATYLRVIDYKSGQTTLEPTKTWWGLQLQLMIYMDAAMGGYPGAQPAGAFYFHVADPLAKLDADDPTQAENDIAKQLQMKGVALADEAVLCAMDHSENALVIPSALTKGGGLRKDARVLAMPQMRALLRRSRTQATELAEALYAGDTSILPAVNGTESSCANCDLQTICGFDPLARGAIARELQPVNMEELNQLLGGAPAAQPESTAE